MRIIFSSILLSVVLSLSSKTASASPIGFLPSWIWDEDELFQYGGRRLKASDGYKRHVEPKDKTLRAHRKLVTLKVGDSSVPGCSASYATIAEALASTTSMDVTIELCAGIFDELVSIDTPGFKLKIKGEGQDLTTMKAPDGSSSPFVVAAFAGTELEVEELTVDGANQLFLPRGPPFFQVAGIHCVDCSSLKVKKVNVINTESPAVDVPFFDYWPSGGIVAVKLFVPVEETKIKIEECNISGFNFEGISLLRFPGNGPLDVEVLKNSINGAGALGAIFGQNGIRTSGSKARVMENSVTNVVNPVPGGFPFGGLVFRCLRKDSEIKYNIVDNADLGIDVSASSDIKISKNIISRAGAGVSFDLDDTSGVCLNDIVGNEVKDNVITSSLFYGVFFRKDDGDFNGTLADNKVEGNYIADSVLAGIAVETGEDNEFKDNDIKDTGEFGIVVLAGSGCLFNGNEIKNSGSSGIVSGGIASLHLFENNEIDSSDEYGIWIQEGATNNTFKKNDITNSGVDGILDDGTGTVLDDNNIA